MGSSKADWETNGWVGRHQMVFLCIPVRTAVFLFSTGTALLGLLLLHWRFAVEKDRRPFVGGYSEESRILIDILEMSALLWGTLGAFGALYLKASWIRVFYYYEAVRILAFFAMYALDMPQLLNCELARDDPEGFVKRFGPNEAIFSLAGAGACDDDRLFFYLLSPLSLLLIFQALMAAQNLLSEIEEVPRYLLSIPKETPSGAFYCQNMATRSACAERFTSAGLPVPPELTGFAATPAMPLMAAPMQSFGSGSHGMPLRSMASRGLV
eukprot:TRINITY_DN91480_c0_g1_i1.p1 TRINITY_DN91480_c0_g1~~TRINITY_DN91480_c0_g1_i1.p1  ORF type:complete len:268 (+),score=54.38 TRINITY_DN91480_c0_g1_i1:109-912(+)